MNGPLRLLTLMLAFAAIYTPMIIMGMMGHAPWFWFSAAMSCLGLYFTVWGMGLAKGWWKT
jgi:hypothetical protein